MAIIKLEMKCLNCNEDSLENFDIKFMDELGFPDAECWSITSGTQCNACFERVSWRRVLTPDESVGIEARSDNVICANSVECDDEGCHHKVPHEPYATCRRSACYVKDVRVQCDKVK